MLFIWISSCNESWNKLAEVSPQEPTAYSSELEGGRPYPNGGEPTWPWHCPLSFHLLAPVALTLHQNAQIAFQWPEKLFSFSLNASLELTVYQVDFPDVNMVTAYIDPQSLMDWIHTGSIVWNYFLVCLCTKCLKTIDSCAVTSSMRIFTLKLIKMEYLVSQPH